MPNSLRISIGCDPELFLRDNRSGDFISAHDLLPGTKIKPHPVKFGAVQVDGVAAEFNITPSFTANDFVKSIALVENSIKEFVGGNIDLVKDPVAIFDPGYFKSLPDDVKELGCNPDWNAWTGQINKKPDGDIRIEGKIMRTAAGHIHIGWGDSMDINDPIHFEDCRIIAKQLDYYLGMFSLKWDKDSRRRQMYGKAGSFRPKSYGVEYRPLSNMWLRSPDLQYWVWSAAYKAVTDIITHGISLEDKFGNLAQSAIDESQEWWDVGHKCANLNAYTDMSLPPKLIERPVVKVETTPFKRKSKANFMYPSGLDSTTTHNDVTVQQALDSLGLS